MRKISILGASGSIGTQTLDIIDKTIEEYKIEAISVGSNMDIALTIIEKYNPNLVCTRTNDDLINLKNKFPNTKFVFGDAGLIEVSTYKKDENILLVSALVGSVGLIPTVEAIKIKRDVCLANKETLVMAGEFVMELSRQYGTNVFPIDSEHSAIWQCLQGENIDDVKKIIITASGGSFRDLSREELKKVTKEDALKHPNWSMGSKITIDSATMMNKGFEVIEAHHLFNIPYNKIETILHRQSIIHSMVEYNDNQIKAQLATSDMRLPIIYAINYPSRTNIKTEGLDLLKHNNLTFEELSFDRYPCLKYAYECGIKGNIFPTVLNAVNEVCVYLFLNNKISFLDIEKIIKEELDQTKIVANLTLEKIISIDKEIKEKIYTKYKE